jgi:hypothetical protein
MNVIPHKIFKITIMSYHIKYLKHALNCWSAMRKKNGVEEVVDVK